MLYERKLTKGKKLHDLLSDIELLSTVALDVNEATSRVLLEEIRFLASQCFNSPSAFRCTENYFLAPDDGDIPF